MKDVKAQLAAYFGRDGAIVLHLAAALIAFNVWWRCKSFSLTLGFSRSGLYKMVADAHPISRLRSVYVTRQWLALTLFAAFSYRPAVNTVSLRVWLQVPEDGGVDFDHVRSA